MVAVTLKGVFELKEVGMLKYPTTLASALEAFRRVSKPHL